MIEDIQIFRSIYQDESTKKESVVKLACELSEIAVVNQDSWDGWVTEEEVVDLTLKSGCHINILANFEEILKLWRDFKKQQTDNPFKIHLS